MRKEGQECLLLLKDNALLPWNQARLAKSLLPTQLGKLARTGIDGHGLIPTKCFFRSSPDYSGYKKESIASCTWVLKILPQLLKGEPLQTEELCWWAGDLVMPQAETPCATASCELTDDHFSSQQVPKISMPLFVADAVEWATQSSLCKASNTATDYSSCGASAPALVVSQAVFCIISTTGEMHLCATVCIRDLTSTHIMFFVANQRI